MRFQQKYIEWKNIAILGIKLCQGNCPSKPQNTALHVSSHDNTF